MTARKNPTKPEPTEPEVVAPVVEDVVVVEAPVADAPEVVADDAPVVAETVAAEPEVVADEADTDDKIVEPGPEPVPDPSPFGVEAHSYAELAADVAAGARIALAELDAAYLAVVDEVPSHPASMLHVRRLQTALTDLGGAVIVVEQTASALAAHAAEHEA